MNKKEIISAITSKRDFSKLPEEDILRAYKKFEKRECSDEEKVRLTRDLLRKVYSAFVSNKLLGIKDKEEEWILRKHLSTRERIGNYTGLYKRLLSRFKDCSVIDLGSGINGFSYKFFPPDKHVKYVGVESMGQLVELMNFYFKNKKLNARAVHESLFNLAEIKRLIDSEKRPRLVFLFKVVDSLEMIEKDYSKTLLKEIMPSCDIAVVSFATRSMIRGEKFNVTRKWIINFIGEQFRIIEDFEIKGERYIVFENSM